ncbi:MAG: PAS domain S-box protein [Nitrospirota bacterium]
MPRPLHVVIVEDSEDDSLLLLRELRRAGYDPVHERVDTPEAMRSALTGRKWDIVISDYILPKFSGPEALAVLKDSGLDLPFIIVSGNIGEDIAVEAMKAGAHDYIIKGNFSRLAPAVERELREAGMRRERRKAEEDLRVSEEQYHRLFESSLDAVVLMKPDGAIVSANPAACKLLDMTEDEIRRSGRSHIVNQADPHVASLISERERTGKTRGEVDVIRKDGTRVPCEISSVLFRDREGNPMLSIIARDITERRDTLRKAEVMNALLKLFTDTITRREYLYAACGLLRDWSACRNVGVRIEHPDHKVPFEACDGYNEAFLKQENGLSLVEDQCICTRVIAGKPGTSDLPFMTVNGSFYCNNTPVFMDGLTDDEHRQYRSACIIKNGFKSLAVVPIRYRGRPLGAIHLADQQEGRVPLKNVEFLEQLGYIIGEAIYRFDVEEERARLVSALEATAEGVVITEPSSGLIQYVNHAFEQITGYTRDELLGQKIHLLDSGRQGTQFYQELREAIRRDGVWRGQMVSKKKDGTQYFEDSSVSPVKGPLGETLNYVSLKRDITERLRLESIAESVNTMDNIGYIFSGVRHEIGNPINSVNMILGILSSKLPNLSQDAIRDYLDRIVGQIGRVEFLLRSLKSFNMYETQEPQQLRVASFMEQFLPLVKDDLETKDIALDVRMDPQADRLQADPRALQQVLLNLVTNAADAVRERDQPKIAVNISRSDGIVRIEVEDNGCGIPEDKVKDLFKPFYTTKASGTGLGLVIVKKMITRMSGTIAIESRRDSGTVVTISLPEGTHEER